MPSVESGSGEPLEQEVEVPWRSPAVQVIVASVFTGPMDAPLIGPVLPEIARFFQISDAQASLVITVYSIPGILLAPVLGILADRFGRRRTLIFSLLVYGSLGTAVAFAPNFNTVLVLRFLQGCAGGSILSSIAMTIVGDLYDGAQRNAVMGATGAAASVGAAIYPALGGALASVS
ncbi:MAG: MFS transporter, partial [Halobacteria archaeon]|nr:MFS transporter [Halobacteria archaeon]